MMAIRMLPRVCGNNMTKRASTVISIPYITFFNPSSTCVKEARMITTSGTISGDEDKSKTSLRIKLEKSSCPSAGKPQQYPAGLLFHYDSIKPTSLDDDDVVGENELDNLIPKGDDNITELVTPPESNFFIPQVKLHDGDGMKRKRVLVLCTGGTLTMAPDPEKGGSLTPVQGALTEFMKTMLELQNEKMPDVVVHEYTPLLDSSDMGPPDWSLLAKDIKANYLHFDGFVVLMGTDTMAYTATALSFMLENLGKPVVFTGSQIPLAEPHTDARQNLIMALIFAARDAPISEVTIFFHDKLIRACRSTKGENALLRLYVHFTRSIRFLNSCSLSSKYWRASCI